MVTEGNWEDCRGSSLQDIPGWRLRNEHDLDTQHKVNSRLFVDVPSEERCQENYSKIVDKS